MSEFSRYANYAECSEPGTYNIQCLTNNIKIYLVGGGGGGGGGGGSQHNNRGPQDRSGGGGGSGSSGAIQAYVNSNKNISGKMITVTIGRGGNAGNAGADGHPTAGNGNDGNDGERSSINVDSDIYNAAGGTGGKGGIGGWEGGRKFIPLPVAGTYVNNAPGGKGGIGSGGGTYGRDGGYGSNSSHIRKLNSNNQSFGGGESLPTSNSISAINSGVYPNNNKPGKGGAGGAGHDGKGGANNGQNGGKGYARIYFMD